MGKAQVPSTHTHTRTAPVVRANAANFFNILSFFFLAA
jgi:hypothetical protein